jgi:hypothetical protein
MAVREPLPGADRALIPAAKLRDYALSPLHPVGRLKAAFFARLGYRHENWRTLEADLRTQHLRMPAERLGTASFGTKYRIVAALVGPSGRRAFIVSVWIVPALEQVPRLVTLYPGGRLA